MKSLIIIFFLVLFHAVSLLAQETSSVVYNESHTNVDESKNLKILSWNIQMLPRLLLPVRRGPVRRARLIPEFIIKDNIDVVVFQECFDIRSRRILKRKLKESYPFKDGPANRMPFPVLFTNSGIVIYSKYPIVDSWRFPYKWREKHGHDKFARKGCLMVEIALPNGQHVQVLGTHLQAGGPHSIRHSQYAQLRKFIDQHKKENVPQFICGDFNTKQHDTTNYNIMIQTIDAADATLEGELCCTSDGLLNDMKDYDPNDRKVIDYILYKPNGVQPKFFKREVKQYQFRWSKKYKDLSDHNAVLGTIRF